MTDPSLLKLIGVALGSGLTVKVLDILYAEFRRRSERDQSAERFVDEHLDPLLKSADELVGKLHALGREDFKQLRDLEAACLENNTALSSLMYLFARFWAQVETIRIEGLSVAIAQDTRGEQLQKFFNCLESQKVRLIDRASQRAIGETCLVRDNGDLRAVSYIEFVRIGTTEEAAKWLRPLQDIVKRGWHTEPKQGLLAYATVLHAMLDTLDPQHNVTKKRPAIPNKLSKRTWKNLRYRVFGVYLDFVIDHKKYMGPPKTKGPVG